MGDPTTTRAILRYNICVELNMPFFRRYSNGYLTIPVGHSCTSSKINHSSLTQKGGAWNGSWHHHLTTGEISKIRAFESLTNSYQLEIPLAATPADGSVFQILSIWNPIDIHHAINRAIDSAKRIYIDTVTNRTRILQEDTLEYSLASLTTTPWIINKVYIERNTSRRTGMVQSATATTVVVENSSVTSGVNANWIISIYDGTGKGMQTTVTSVSGTTINVANWTLHPDWVANPDSTSKYCLWDTTDQTLPWQMIEGYALDSKEWPTTLYLQRSFPQYNGMRIGLEYTAQPAGLTTEAGTSIVPAEYILNKAVSLLYGQRLSDNKIDRESFYAESERYREMAERFLMQNLPQKPDTTLKRRGGTEYYIEDDPLGWR